MAYHCGIANMPPKNKHKGKKQGSASDIAQDCIAETIGKKRPHSSPSKESDPGKKMAKHQGNPYEDSDCSNLVSEVEMSEDECIGSMRNNKEPPTTQSLMQKLTNIERETQSNLMNLMSEQTSKNKNKLASNIMEMRLLLQTAISSHSKLEGKVEALEKELDKQRQNTERITEKIATQADTPAQNLTYAQRVGISTNFAHKLTQIRDPPNVIKILPVNSDAATSSEDTRKQIKKLISPNQEKLQVLGMRNINGNGVLITTANKKDLDTIKQNLQIKDAGFSVGEPSKKNPKIIIFDLQKNETEKKLMKHIISQNGFTQQEQKTIQDGARFSFKTGNRNKETVHWVLDTTPQARNLLMKRDRIFIDWYSCRIKDYIAVTRCYKCQGYGHTTKYCRSKVDICGHCGREGHRYNDCPNKSKTPSCSNCKRNGHPHAHAANDRNCTAHEIAITRTLERIDYG